MFEFLRNNSLYYAIFCVAVTAIVIFIVDVNYKYFFKRALDFLLAFLAIVVCSIPLITCAFISKMHVEKGERALEKTPVLGLKGKIVYLHGFAGLRGSVKKFARIFDVFLGNLSFVGVKPLPVSDGAFISDDDMGRFSARPGILSHLVCGGDENLTYEDMFALDIRYAKKRELFTDIWIVLKTAALYIRGERNYAGETGSNTYAEILLVRGNATEEDLLKSEEYALEAVQAHENAKQIKKQRYK